MSMLLMINVLCSIYYVKWYLFFTGIYTLWLYCREMMKAGFLRILDSKFKSIYKILLFFLELLAYFTTFNHKKVYHNTTCEECCRSVGFPQRAILKYIIPDLEWNTWNTRSSYPGME